MLDALFQDLHVNERHLGGRQELVAEAYRLAVHRSELFDLPLPPFAAAAAARPERHLGGGVLGARRRVVGE
jgi:hypothetical protein